MRIFDAGRFREGKLDTSNTGCWDERVAGGEQFVPRVAGWVKNLFILYEGDAHILTDFDPPPLISMCFPGFLVPTYVLNTGGNFQKILAISHSHSKDHGASHGCREYEPVNVGGLGLGQDRQEERLRREIAQEQLGAKRPLEKCKASGGNRAGMYHDCTSQRGPVVDGKIPINRSCIYHVGIYGWKNIPKNSRKEPPAK